MSEMQSAAELVGSLVRELGILNELDAERIAEGIALVRARDKARGEWLMEAAAKAVCQWCADAPRRGPAPYENATVHPAQRVNAEYVHSLIWKSGGEGVLSCSGSKVRAALRPLLDSEGK